jgi:hypothetical protein
MLGGVVGRASPSSSRTASTVGGVLASSNQQRQGGVHLAFRGGGRQMQHPHVLPVGTSGQHTPQPVITLAEGGGWEPFIAIAIGRKGTRLAD